MGSTASLNGSRPFDDQQPGLQPVKGYLYSNRGRARKNGQLRLDRGGPMAALPVERRHSIATIVARWTWALSTLCFGYFCGGSLFSSRLIFLWWFTLKRYLCYTLYIVKTKENSGEFVWQIIMVDGEWCCEWG
jgi:hypothetical protein